ncbi:mRNA splicing protein [Starmerella bacillaris]|uniref:Sm protein B n=1 Tax=Starmerella bacillaris TaxID=1247836 RepID=A0AAV5RP70_STABA|nr:mRNA splicing protein [Starmerella bacillaris]
MAPQKLEKLLQKQVRVIQDDGRHLVGNLKAFDGYMNLVLEETQEFRKSKKGESLQRPVGLVIVRGETIVSTILESSYSGDESKRKSKQPITMQL